MATLRTTLSKLSTIRPTSHAIRVLSFSVIVFVFFICCSLVVVVVASPTRTTQLLLLSFQTVGRQRRTSKRMNFELYSSHTDSFSIVFCGISVLQQLCNRKYCSFVLSVYVTSCECCQSSPPWALLRSTSTWILIMKSTQVEGLLGVAYFECRGNRRWNESWRRGKSWKWWWWRGEILSPFSFSSFIPLFFMKISLRFLSFTALLLSTLRINIFISIANWWHSPHDEKNHYAKYKLWKRQQWIRTDVRKSKSRSCLYVYT